MIPRSPQLLLITHWIDIVLVICAPWHLSGAVPKEFANLSHLEVLDLRDNVLKREFMALNRLVSGLNRSSRADPTLFLGTCSPISVYRLCMSPLCC